MKKLLLITLCITACGQQGPKGDQGAPGTPGTVINAEPFCPSIPGAIGYANRESYIVIGTDVYAVYADGIHTFLTLLNPGSYITTDGRSCSFIVQANGTVL